MAEKRLPLITNIQKYSIHDGPGIRTTVFFKGCPLSCTWCHNPETQSYLPELVRYEDKCCGCMACADVCPEKAIDPSGDKPVFDRECCIRCGKCADTCLHSAVELLARTETVDRLVSLLLRDQAFYEESGGGVTLSGGEVMAQDITYLETLVKKLDRRGISVVIDTCGYAPYEKFERLSPYVEAYLYDIKFMDAVLHEKYTGKDNGLILDNLEKLAADGKKIYLRLPLIAGLNDKKEDMEAVAAWLREHKVHPAKIHLLPYHDIGKDKYKRLDRAYEGIEFEAPSKEHMEELIRVLAANGFANCQIGG